MSDANKDPTGYEIVLRRWDGYHNHEMTLTLEEFAKLFVVRQGFLGMGGYLETKAEYDRKSAELDERIRRRTSPKDPEGG